MIAPHPTPATPEHLRCSLHFALITIAGNRTRYEVVRAMVEADHRVSAAWSPIRTWVDDDWLGPLPGIARVRARHLLDARRALAAAPDAMVIHAFETYFMYGLLRDLRRLDTAVVWNSDGPPPRAGTGVAASLKRRVIRTTDLFVPFSHWAAAGLIDRYPDIDRSRIRVLHPGLAIEKWPRRPGRREGGRFRLLFVGGEPDRKGLDTLLDAFDSGLEDDCELHIMTQAAHLSKALRSRLEGRPHVRLDLDQRATPAIYSGADALVLPTRIDCSSWVALEAMATGVPVITTAIGGIPDIVLPEKTGLIIGTDDASALRSAVRRLSDSQSLYSGLSDAGRAHVEGQFDARTNTGKMVDLVVGAISDRRQGRTGNAGPTGRLAGLLYEAGQRLSKRSE